MTKTKNHNCKEKVAYAIKKGMLPPQVDVDMERTKTIQDIEIDHKIAMKEIKDLQKEIPRKKIGEKKRGRKRKEPLKSCKVGYIPIKFPDKYVSIYRALLRIAEKEHRTINMQAMYFIRQGIEGYKERKGKMDNATRTDCFT